MVKKIPIALIWSRLIFGILIAVLSIFDISYFKAIAISLIAAGLISDVFDGIIARRLQVSTERLRRLDSTIDQIFWCLVALAAFIEYPEFFYGNWVKLVILIGAEALTYAVSYAKFKKEVATHAISSKIWTLILFATLIEIIAIGNSGVLFLFCFYVGVASRLEVLAILLILKRWANDVPSVYHAVLLRQGKPIKRHKLFNG